MKTTQKGTKKFSKEEKLAIINEAERNGQKLTLEKYDIYASTFYYWKRKLLVYGESGLSHKKTKDREQMIKKLEKENESLKILLGEKELESKLKDELLKKKYPEWKKWR
jgi:putative transposase